MRAVLVAGSLGLPELTAAQPSILDTFDDLSVWTVSCSDGVVASVSRCPGTAGNGLRLDFEFKSGAGFCVLHRALPMDLPENYRFAFDLRGTAPPNNLEFKLVDPSGDNVWWVNRPAYQFEPEWRRISYRARHVKFAWGPSGGARLDKVGALEFAVASSQGGKGFVCFDEITFEPLEKADRPAGEATLRYSSMTDATTVPQRLGSDNRIVWTSAPNDLMPWIEVAFDRPREFGGLVLDWDPVHHPRTYQVETSLDGIKFEVAAKVERGLGGHRYVPITDAEARVVRVRASPSDSGDVVLKGIEIAPVEFSQTPSSVLSRVARDAPRGRWPRHLLGKQNYWTIVGVAGDRDEGLLSIDGALELRKSGCTIEPFLSVQGRLVTWADATIENTLVDGDLPIPTATWKSGPLRLDITSLADGANGESVLRARYTLTNVGTARSAGSLVLAARPVQVLPAWQELNTSGGAAPIQDITWDGRHLLLNATMLVEPSPLPNRYDASTFAEGDVIERIERRLSSSGTTVNTGAQSTGLQQEQGTTRSVHDPAGFASAALVYDFDLGPGERTEVCIAAPFDAAAGDPKKLDSDLSFDDRLAAARALWRSEVDRAQVHLPASARAIENTLRSTLAYILINRDGPAIQPGSRNYERSWIRDGCLTSSALLEFGHSTEAVEFIDWYAEKIFPDGKVPCVVDRRGPDPVPENDSHGEYIFAVMNAYQFTRDLTILQRHWPKVQLVMRYIGSLRAQRMSPAFEGKGTRPPEPGKPAVPVTAFYGLMPESISHEGYSSKPMHSYWDDFFTLRGLHDGAAIARTLGEQEAAQNYQALHDAFMADLYNSIDQCTKAHGIQYVPGCVELGDFDSTSTTIALWPGGQADGPAHDLLLATFDRYWVFAMNRAKPDAAWDAYTPYEHRHVGAFVRLGQPERAHAVLDFLMNDRRPLGWNQWAEVVWKDRDTPRFIGDMPHTWCGSDFVNSVRTMLVYERESDSALVLFAGVSRAWAEEPGGVSFVRLPTHFGPLTASVRLVGGSMVAEVMGSIRAPGGISVRSPFGFTPRRVTVNGLDAQRMSPDGVHVRELPATIVFEP